MIHRDTNETHTLNLYNSITKYSKSLEFFPLIKQAILKLTKFFKLYYKTSTFTEFKSFS
jgi:hypothetical protein